MRIAREVSEALSHAHSYGIIHRDIKPDNVMISGGHAVVSDFGIARAVSAAGGDSLTQTGMAVGTPAYMSPEQAAGDPSVDARADVYSLACMLYEMLVGQVPFTGPNAQAIMARHTMDMVTPPQIMRQSIPDELQDVIMCAMEKTPADRFRTAGELAEALKGVESGSYSAVRRSTMYRTAQLSQVKSSSWKKFAVPGVSALAALVIGIGGWQLFAGGTSTVAADALFDPRRIAVLYFDDLSPDGELQHVADGLTEGLIDNLSQVRGLDVVSRNGVAPYRRGLVRTDSIAQILEAGSLIEGTVKQDGDRVRITARLVEGTSGADFDRASFDIDSAELLVGQDSVVETVARFLRQRLGEEVRVREIRSGTESVEAWALTQRAEKLRKDAAAAADSDVPAAALSALRSADSILSVAEAADPDWTEPTLLRGWVAHDQAQLNRDDAAASYINDGLAHTERVLERSPSNAKGLELRGLLRFRLFRLEVTPDRDEWETLLLGAKEDLEAAVDADPALVDAQIALSYLRYQPQIDDVAGALLAAQAAYELDAYLDNSDALLSRMFWSSLDLENFSQARRWCAEGARRYPADYRFVRCQLWLMASPAVVDPDVALASQLLARMDSLAPGSPVQREHVLIDAEMTHAGVLGRAGMADSAKSLLASSREKVTHENDAGNRFLYVEAIMRSLAGDYDAGIDLLKRYVAAHPDHHFAESQGTVFWYRDLRNHPRWREVAGLGR